MLRELTRRRLEAKRAERARRPAPSAPTGNGIQGSFKVLINSFYGYLGYGRATLQRLRRRRAGDARRARRSSSSVVAELEATGATVIEVDTDGVYFVPAATESRRRGELSDTSPACRRRWPRGSTSPTTATTPA